MQPLKPTTRDAILRAAPTATIADVEEYERLVSAHFRKDPSQATRAGAAPDPDEIRLKELEKKIFGTTYDVSGTS